MGPKHWKQVIQKFINARHQARLVKKTQFYAQTQKSIQCSIPLMVIHLYSKVNRLDYKLSVLINNNYRYI